MSFDAGTALVTGSRGAAESALAFLLLTTPVAAQSPGELRGRVLDVQGTPVVGATVALTALPYSVRTDSLGRFVLTGTPGSTLNFTITATAFRSDSASVVLTRGRVVERDFTLRSIDVPLPEPNPSDRVLRGRVTDTEGVPLTYANIQVNGGRRYMSDDSGRFVVPVPEGTFSILVRRIGFEVQEVAFKSAPTTSVRVQMRAVARVLPEQRIVGQAAFVALDLHGFYRRMKEAERGINYGYFITPEDLERRKPTFITSMVLDIPSVRVISQSKDPRTDMILGALGCKMTVYLDRVRIVGKLPGAVDDLVNMLVVPSQVAAMEVYPRGVGAPPEYQSMNGTCGVVLIWTK